MPRPIDRRAVLKASLIAGFIAGMVDIGAACLINQAPPKLILQSIASGLLGASAYKLTWAAELGFGLQVVMSIVIAAIFALAAAEFASLRRHPYWSGLTYGAGVFAVMNLIVVPLAAAAPKPAHVTPAWIVANVAAMLIFGLLVSVATSRILGEDAKD